MSQGEFGIIGLRGTEADRRYSLFFYEATKALLEQEKAQLKAAQDITHPQMLSFFVSSMGGGVLGAKYPMQPKHLIELAYDTLHIERLMHYVKKDKDGLPHLTHPDGYLLIKPFLDELKMKFSVMLYRSFRDTPVRKWLEPVEEKPEEREEDVLAQLLKGAFQKEEPEIEVEVE